MSNAELWDLDTSGGIMEQIQMLVAPPVSADAVRRSRRRRERDVYRRPGRAVNHDCCDSCKEGGDLICCDKCPAAFHLLCHDPPLTEEELPTGEWLCHKCRITPLEAKDDDVESTSSSKSSIRSNRGKRPPVHMELNGESEHPLRTLAKAARLMNPVQFDVGKEITCNKPLPGSSKRVYGKAARNLPKKQTHELDNGMVPLPAKTCFTCNKSCRIAPLVQCDYCPLLFHLDCLDPPLTSLPQGRWMCPNHVEHFLDSHLLKSQSLTERLRLWDRYTGLVNNHTVMVDFLNRVHRKNPMFRLKRKLPPRSTISVPPAIKHFYKNPTSLLPSPGRPPPHATTATNLPGSRGVYAATLEEQEEWLSSVVSMQSSIAKFLAQKQLQKCFDGVKPSESAPAPNKPTASVAPVVQKDSEPVTSSTLSSSNLHCDSFFKSSPLSSSSTSSTNTAIESPDCDNKQQSSTALVNGEQKLNMSSNSAVERGALFHRTLDVSSHNALSLLHNSSTKGNGNVNDISNSSSTMSAWNGELDVSDIEMSDGTDERKFESGCLPRGRSNSADSIPSPPYVGSKSWMEGEQQHIGTNLNGNAGSNSKSILINSFNKSGGVITKVLPGISQTTKVILPNSKACPGGIQLGVNNSTSSTPQARVIIQPSKASPTTPAGSGRSSSTSHSVCMGKSSNVTANNSNIFPAITDLNIALQQWIAEGSDSDLTGLDEKLTQLLAWQRLQQLLPPSTPTIPTTPPATCLSASSSVGKKGLLNVYLSQQSAPEVRSRAVLCPLFGKGQVFPMPYRSLKLGTGADMDVCLSECGQCNFISGHHATIFYDEMSRHFELLNYSEHGTTVDNVLYSCDFSDKPVTTPQPSPVVAAVRNIIKKRTDNIKLGSGDGEEDRVCRDKLKMCARANESLKPCNCKVSGSSLIGGSGAGWEGTALLHHGSYVKVGCLQFVFSIVDQAPDQYHLPKSTSAASFHSKLSSSSSSSNSTTTRFSSMPLLSSSQYLHNQPSTSLLKTHLKSAMPP